MEETGGDDNERFLPEFGVRVFLVEDNAEHAFIAVTVIRQLLGEASEVIVAENAEEAVGLIGQFTDSDRPDLMLVDLRLPENGGFAVLTAARGHDPCAHVPTFVITSSLYDQDIAKSYELGASAVLCKPLSRATLREELIRIGKLAPTSAAARTQSTH
jgi:CheY-like chemotaxis protein